MRRYNILVLLVILAIFLPAKAQALDLKECIQRGMAMSDKIKAAQDGSNEAEMQRLAAIGGFMPGMTAKASWLWIDAHNTLVMDTSSIPAQYAPLIQAMDLSTLTALPDHNHDLTITAYQPLTQLGQIAFYNKMARNGKKIADLQYELTEDNVALLLGGAYFGVLANRGRVSALEKAQDQVARLVKDAENMMAQGMITKADLLKFQLRRDEVEMQLMQAREDLAQAKSTVARYLNLTSPEVDYEDYTPSLAAPRELDWYLSQGQKQRPDLQIVGLSVRNAQAAKGAAFWENLPKISAVASQDWNDDGLLTTPDRTTSGGLVMEWNFWDWGSTLNKARAARFQAKRAEHQANATQQDILLSIEKAWRDDRVAHQQVMVQKNSVTEAEENFRIERNRFDVGKTTTTDLLTAQTQLTSAETGYTGALYGAAMADASLSFSVGNKPFPDIMGGSPNE